MESKISKRARTELIEAVKERYREASKDEKNRILNEFTAVAECHRKHAIRLLSDGDGREMTPAVVSRRVYDDAVRQALIVVWEASDRICSKRLKVAIPSLVEALERHGHLQLETTVRERLLSISPATIDRLLTSVRETATQRRRRRRVTKASVKVPVRTFSDWDKPLPGFLEIDFVLHCGGSVAGERCIRDVWVRLLV